MSATISVSSGEAPALMSRQCPILASSRILVQRSGGGAERSQLSTKLLDRSSHGSHGELPTDPVKGLSQ
eukprot:1713062-Heterocapsa_arctica.AAC.1